MNAVHEDLSRVSITLACSGISSSKDSTKFPFLKWCKCGARKYSGILPGQNFLAMLLAELKPISLGQLQRLHCTAMYRDGL